MRAKQIFEIYDRRGKTAIDRLRYCPQCGSRGDLQTLGNSRRLTCQHCGFVLYRNPFPGVVALVVDNNRILLGKRSQGVFAGGKWSLPGGFIEFDEDFLSATHREIREETGLSVNINSILSVVSNFFSPELHTLVIVLLAQRVSGTLQPGDDMVQLEWFPLSGPLPDMAFEADEHIITRYHNTKLAGTPVDLRFARI